MKEIIKKIILCVLVVAVVIGVGSYVLKGDDTVDVDQSTAGTTSGSADQVQGSTSSPSGNGVNATTGNASQGQNDTQNGGQTVSGQQGVTSSADVNSPSHQTPQVSQGVQNSTTQPQVTPVIPGVDQPQKVNKIDTYMNIFKSGRFIMKVNEPDLGLVTMAMSGNKMFVEASMEGLTLKMLYDGDKPNSDNPQTGTWYIIIDKIKKYSPMPADMVGDMNVEEMISGIAKGDGDTVYTTSYEVVNGEQLECESCVDDNGNTTKYYFRGDQLVRSDSISPDGSVSTTEFMEISANVDDSLFTIPAGYAKWDITWLMKMMG